MANVIQDNAIQDNATRDKSTRDKSTRDDATRGVAIHDFPFAALVALDELRLALKLAALDRRLSVLLRGDKGAGKSTAARGLGALLRDSSRRDNAHRDNAGGDSAHRENARRDSTGRDNAGRDGVGCDNAGRGSAGRGSAGRGGAESAADVPFINLPIGATEDRILGGLDIARTLNGEPTLKSGLLAAAHGGILYIDEVNLLPHHLADAMLDAVASGVHVVEREGISARQDADFVLIGSMNPEEGTLRPQLLDRFALVVDVTAPSDPVDRRIAVERRLAFDRDPEAFADEWRKHQEMLAVELRRARSALPDVTVHADLLDLISEQVCAHGVRSLRADLAIVRASRALAALEGVDTVSADHVARVLPLALRHRICSASHLAEAPPLPSSANVEASTNGNGGDKRNDGTQRSGDDGRNNDDARNGDDARNRDARSPGNDAVAGGDQHPSSGNAVFAPLPIVMPRILAPGRPDASGRAPTRHAPAASVAGAARGPAIGVRQTTEPRELDARATIVHAIGQTGSARPRPDDLHEIVRKPTGGRRYLFVIDASGSQAAQQRMRLVKGAVEGLLGTSVRRGDEVAIVTFRGPVAEVALTPTSDANVARQALHYLPTGGRTPLAHAFELAAGLVTDDTVLVLLTDGRANVALHSDDPWADALDAAARVACPALVIDSESGPDAAGRALEIATRMRAAYQRLDALDRSALIDLIRR